MNSIYWHPRPFSARTLVFVLVSGPLGGNFEIGLEYNLFRLVIQDQSRLVERRYFITLSLLMFFPSHIFHYNLNSNKTCVKIKSLSEVSRSHQLMWWSSKMLVEERPHNSMHYCWFPVNRQERFFPRQMVGDWRENLWTLLFRYQAWTGWKHADLTGQKTEW